MELKMNVLLLMYLKDEEQHGYLDFSDRDFIDVSVVDFMYWLGKQIKEE
jgi:hypothetical protein